MRTLLTTVTPSRTGDDLALNSADVANGNRFVVDVRGMLLCFVAPGACDVSINVPEMFDGDLTINPRVLTLTPTVPKLWFMADPTLYKQPDGHVYLDFTAACTVALVMTS